MLTLLALAGGCAHAPAAAPAPPPKPTQAVAVLKPAPGQEITGRAEFSLAGDVVTLRLTLDHATPGLHAVHIHAVGDCSGAHFVAAGPHWNPTNDTHGRWGSAHYHLGDIGNVDVDATGHGELVFATRRWQLGTGSADDVLGHAVVVHAGADDFTTQPAGAAGPRVACGVIHTEHGGM